MRLVDLAPCRRCGDLAPRLQQGRCTACRSRDLFTLRLGARGVAGKRPARVHVPARR